MKGSPTGRAVAIWRDIKFSYTRAPSTASGPPSSRRKANGRMRFLTWRRVRYGSVATGAHCAPLQVGANIAHRGALLIHRCRGPICKNPSTAMGGPPPLSRRGKLKTRFLTRRRVRYELVETGAHSAPLRVNVIQLRNYERLSHWENWRRRATERGFYFRKLR